MTKQNYPFSGRKANYNYAKEKREIGIKEMPEPNPRGPAAGQGWQQSKMVVR